MTPVNTCALNFNNTCECLILTEWFDNYIIIDNMWVKKFNLKAPKFSPKASVLRPRANQWLW
jgi:hypothetical protein